MHASRLVAAALLVSVAVVIDAGCNTKADDVCEMVGDCEQGGSTEWVKACQNQARALLEASQGVQCDGFFYVYYRCADENYACDGATASFPGCEAKRGNLDDCLARTADRTACGQLASMTAACAKDAGAGAALSPGPGCTTTRECTAKCYLEHVSNVCEPRPDELSGVASCTATCP